MKEHPILFKAEMVRAILEGRKTQTRRIIKKSFCPYGIVGHRLWVRETFVIESNYNLDSDYLPPFNDERPVKIEQDMDNEDYWTQCHYRATDITPELHYDDLEEPGCRWRPSIFMPRWASRINLEITNIRVERLQDITEEDAIAEGVEKTDWEYSCEPYRNYLIPRMKPGCNFSTAISSFLSLWASINGKRIRDSNPYVWVIEFKRVMV